MLEAGWDTALMHSHTHHTQLTQEVPGHVKWAHSQKGLGTTLMHRHM